MKERPGTAWGLALANVISNAAGAGLTYALFKIGDKVQKLDRAIGRARDRHGEAEI
jgi:hypothetical protein